jgi:hypothetical protein
LRDEAPVYFKETCDFSALSRHQPLLKQQPMDIKLARTRGCAVAGESQ